MFTEDAIALLESGSALIVGLTLPDGSPHASRGGGLDVEADGRAVLIMATADAAASGLQVGDAPDVSIAITAGDVQTLASAQVKGRLLSVEEAGPEDQARKDRYFDEFCASVHDTDGTPVEVIERWRPVEIVRCRLLLDELFVQTPGPGAGASIGPVGAAGSGVR